MSGVIEMEDILWTITYNYKKKKKGIEKRECPIGNGTANES